MSYATPKPQFDDVRTTPPTISGASPLIESPYGSENVAVFSVADEHVAATAGLLAAKKRSAHAPTALPIRSIDDPLDLRPRRFNARALLKTSVRQRVPIVAPGPATICQLTTESTSESHGPDRLAFRKRSSRLALSMPSVASCRRHRVAWASGEYGLASRRTTPANAANRAGGLTDQGQPLHDRRSRPRPTNLVRLAPVR